MYIFECYSKTFLTSISIVSMQLNSSSIQITSVVDEILFIEIKDPELKNAFFEYKVVNTDGRMLRRGNFSGPHIQLRLLLLPAGKYFFELAISEQKKFAYAFEKIASPRLDGNRIQHFH